MGPNTFEMHRMFPCVHDQITSRCMSLGKALHMKCHKVVERGKVGIAEKEKDRGKITTCMGDRDDDMDTTGYAMSLVDTFLPHQHTCHATSTRKNVFFKERRNKYGANTLPWP